jgi:hypothetical protein
MTAKDGARAKNGSRGHIDNSIVIWIMLILALIAVPRFVEQATGQTLSAFWQGLPADRTGFLVRSLIFVVAIPLVTAVVAFSGLGGQLRPRRLSDRIVIRIPQVGAQTFGLGICALGLYLTFAGLAGQGLFWWVVVVVGLGCVLLAIPIVGQNDHVVVEADLVAWESRLFRSVTRRQECAIPGSDPAAVTTESRRTGGAFGQPLTMHYSVNVGGHELFEGTSESRAEELKRAVTQALEDLETDATAG